MPSSRRIKPPTDDRVAGRIARYVNKYYQGNIRAAAADLGCSYDQLYHAARGTRTKPNLALLMVLTQSTGYSLEFWLWGER